MGHPWNTKAWSKYYNWIDSDLLIKLWNSI